MPHRLQKPDVKDFRKRLLAWFRRNRRRLPWRESTDAYRVWVSEVMLQQTQAATAAPYFTRFVEKYPDVTALARADLDGILKSWEKMGFYARARNLHRAAKIVANEMSGRIPDDYPSFRKLPGVGDYIAAAVMSIAHGRAHAVVDGNVKRVLSRVFTVDAPFNSSSAAGIFKQHADALLDPERPGDFNEAMMELGATVCRPATPECPVCPISRHCAAFLAGRQADFPVRTPRKPVPYHHIAVGVVRRRGRILITRRPESGLLGGLWEFPGGKVKKGETPEAACEREIREEVNLSVAVTGHLAHVDHAYSHFKIGVDVFDCEYKAGRVKLSGPVDFRWILVDEIDRYPFPGANHKFIPLLKDRGKR